MSTPLRLVMGVFAILLLARIGVERAAAMGMEAFGPAGEHISRSPDWSKGVEDVLRHRSRAYWQWVNGSERAYYDGDVQTVNELLDLYSRVELAEHPVVIRPGRPSASSFHGKLTPYVVEFDVPGGISLHHAREHASTGLYSTTPRMIIHLDAALAEHLDELKIPKNVTLLELTLHESAIQVDDAQAQPAGAKDSAEQALLRRLAEFVGGHPQRARVPSPQELFAALQKIDADYEIGFTARGTRVEPAPSGPGKLVGWTVTMGRDRLVVEQLDVEDEDHPKAAGRFEYMNYVGPERMGSIHGYRVWAEGKLIETKPQATFEPVGSIYELLIGRLLWPLGRGFSRRIDRITSISTGADGLLSVAAESDDGSLKRRWELLIDPGADYLVRAAKEFHRDDAEPSYVVETAGILSGGGRSVAHTARWIEGAGGQPASVAVTSVSATTDAELIERTEGRLDQLLELGQLGP